MNSPVKTCMKYLVESIINTFSQIVGMHGSCVLLTLRCLRVTYGTRIPEVCGVLYEKTLELYRKT